MSSVLAATQDISHGVVPSARFAIADRVAARDAELADVSEGEFYSHRWVAWTAHVLGISEQQVANAVQASCDKRGIDTVLTNQKATAAGTRIVQPYIKFVRRHS